MSPKIQLAEDVESSLAGVCRESGESQEEAANAILRSQLTLNHAATDVPVRAGARGLVTRARLLEATLTAIVDPVFTVDQHGGIDFLNPAAEELTGFPREDALGHPVASVVQISVNGFEGVVSDLLQSCLHQGERVEVHERAVLTNRAGLECSIDGVAAPLRNASGNIVGAALVLRDVTARRRAESALTAQRNDLELLVAKRTGDLKLLQDELLKKERLATLGHLTASVSHELRNPLATIRNSMHVLEERIRGTVIGVDAPLDRIDRNVTRCIRIISELLDFAQVRNLQLERVAVDPWVRSVVEELDLPAAVSVEFDLTFGRDADIDPEKLRRAIVNVCENAWDAMREAEPPGMCLLRIQSRSIPGLVELSVADTGPGMSEEVRRQVFLELFSTKRFGVGLGLPIVKQIIEQHGGEIHVQSTLAVGTRVIMRIPTRHT